MIIDLVKYKDKNHIFSWFLLSAIFDKNKGIFDKLGEFDSSNLDISVTINGVEINLVFAMELLQGRVEVMNAENFESGKLFAKQEMLKYIDQKISNLLEIPND